MSKKVFKILSIDGGGIRGVFPAHILKSLSERLGVDVNNYFDMIAGTSTGAIIASAIACNKLPEKIIQLYRENGKRIFASKNILLPKFIKPAFISLYDNNGLIETLKEEFGDIKLGDIKTPLLLPATDIGNGSVHVLKSGYSDEFTRDKEVFVYEAIAASCSAPIYFDPLRVKEYLLADGGVWANNPSLAAVIDAKKRLDIQFDDIKIFSLGTGHSKIAYGVSSDNYWGFLTGLKGKEFINFILSLQAETTNNYLQLMLKKEQILRIDFESDKPLPLDDLSQIDDLISRADREFTHRTEKIKKFFEIT